METTTTSDKQIGAEEEEGEEGSVKSMSTLKDLGFCRKEKRKLAKKLKRKQIRKETALKEREEEEARLNDEEEQRKLELKEKEEAEMMERQRKEFEERERLWIERAAQKAQEEEAQRQTKLLEEESRRNQDENESELKEDDEWEYVEEGPAEIIWQGNEIIVKKKKVKVAKKSGEQPASIEDANKPTSNPLPPQSEVYASYRNTSVSSQQVFESVSQQNPNFGTEQDKAHCPFHIKTGACRFGARCSRAHFYPDKSCTLLIKNMYNGPGLTLEQDEGLECTEEEIDCSYEEFYEDVHTEFLKYGEIVNFKTFFVQLFAEDGFSRKSAYKLTVCKNGSSHLRGNVYVHYKSLESAILAYDSINGRYFAGKQITCEYVGVTRWRVAICGEYMKSRLKTCSRGTACNFIHCFQNPGGDYEWADWDNPPPKYWMKKMVALFGSSDDTGQESWGLTRNSRKISAKYARYDSRRSRSRDPDAFSNSSGEADYDGKRDRWSTPNRKKHAYNRRKMISSTDAHVRLEEEDSDFDNNRCEEKNTPSDHGPRDYYIADIDQYDRHSIAHSERRSKWRDLPDSCVSVKKKYSNYERCEGKEKIHTRDSRENYDDLPSVQKKRNSTKWEYLTRLAKTENVRDEHMASENDEFYVSPSNDRCKSKTSSAEPKSSENVDPSDRWETGSYVPDGSERLRSGFDGNEPCTQRHKPQDESSGRRHGETRSRSHRGSSRGEHSDCGKEENDSSSDELQWDHEQYYAKHRPYKDDKKNKIPQKKDRKECFSSGESKGKSDIEQKEAFDPLKHKSGAMHLRKHQKSSHSQSDQRKRSRSRSRLRDDKSERRSHSRKKDELSERSRGHSRKQENPSERRSRGHSRKQEEQSERRSRGHTKRKPESIDNEERDSGKRSRSR